jgi:hypothetical protein
MTIEERVRRAEANAKAFYESFGAPYLIERRRRIIKLMFRAHYAKEALERARKAYLASLPWDDDGDWAACEPFRLAKIAADEKWERLKRYSAYI